MGFSGFNAGSAGINVATFGIPFWSLSHVGIFATHRAEVLLFESTTLCDLPCAIRGAHVEGVQAVRPEDRFRDYRGRVWVYPLYRPLYECESERLTAFLLDSLGREYDMIGAFRSGGLGFSWFESLLHTECLRSIFCSELVAAAHAHIGLFPTTNASRWSPNRLVRRERLAGLLRRPVRVK